MARPRNLEIERKIEDLWLQLKRQNPRVSTYRVYEEASTEGGENWIPGCPSLRTVQGIIKRAKPVVNFDPDPKIEPFGNQWPDDPDDIAFLFAIREAAMVAVINEPIEFDKRVIKWMLRLSRVFGWPDRWDLNRGEACWRLSKTYADREAIGAAFGREPDFTDLNGYITFRPWDSKEQQVLYWNMIAKKVIPEPMDLRGWDLERERAFDQLMFCTVVDNEIIRDLELFHDFSHLSFSEQEDLVVERLKVNYKLFSRVKDNSLPIPTRRRFYQCVISNVDNLVDVVVIGEAQRLNEPAQSEAWSRVRKRLINQMLETRDYRYHEPWAQEFKELRINPWWVPRETTMNTDAQETTSNGKN